MCQNVFKSNEEKKRKEDFTRLFVAVVSNALKEKVVLGSEKKQSV